MLFRDLNRFRGDTMIAKNPVSIRRISLEKKIKIYVGKICLAFTFNLKSKSLSSPKQKSKCCQANSLDPWLFLIFWTYFYTWHNTKRNSALPLKIHKCLSNLKIKRRLLLTYMIIPSTYEMYSKYSVITVQENDYNKVRKMFPPPQKLAKLWSSQFL